MPTLLATVEEQMLAACMTGAEPEDHCLLAVQHHLAAGGRRVRARICLDAGTRLGLSEADAVMLATACELLHNASLVHDDLIDRSAVRRDSGSIWLLFGKTTAVCAGDLLLASAYAALAGFSATRHIPALLTCMHRRTREVVCGQVAEKGAGSSHALSPSAYEELAKGKSASLLSLALELPLIAASQPGSLDTAYAAAAAFSVTYQIADDLVDACQDESEDSLNVVQVIESQGVSAAQARRLAMQRAELQMDLAIQEAEKLPLACGASFIAEGRKLLEIIRQTVA